ncbi:hypothetical protein M011DRAFT_409512 [Sporormia fimetaria CBS 119925]|uniref:Uncharacterized protein n=1 Tax=Sporormia fimetaria CBS 119925 TaxID=1340428 RepID=A0A6A6V0D2_9PLEO|nr:hypothetical protein M011DRAFT_409512 [Sporormia fimetaria CBS 119925]
MQAPRSLHLYILQAHRAKGHRYPTTSAARKECFKTWYSYALRRGEVAKDTSKDTHTISTERRGTDVPTSTRTYL